MIYRGTALAAVALLAAVPTAAQAEVTAVDRAFVREMIPHQAMAVDMARMHADHAPIKTLATNIVTDQTAEIHQLTAIRKRLKVKALPSGHAEHEVMMRDADTLGLSMEDMGMDMNMDELDRAKPFDRAFIDTMISHHQGAIRMARSEVAKGRSSQLRALARRIVSAQAREIRRMNSLRKAWYGATSPSGGVRTSSQARRGGRPPPAVGPNRATWHGQSARRHQPRGDACLTRLARHTTRPAAAAVAGRSRRLVWHHSGDSRFSVAAVTGGTGGDALALVRSRVWRPALRIVRVRTS